jgi:hypothetical protein
MPIGLSLNGPGFPGSVGGSVGIGFNGGGVTLDGNLGGLGVGVGIGGNGVSIGFGVFGQNFQTIPLPNNKLALYRIVIRSPNGPKTAISTWTFPLSPSSILKEIGTLSMVWDVQGLPQDAGVQRIADLYGNSPPIYVIEGTTGWQRHGTDGFHLTGMDSIAAIQSALNSFAQLNSAQVARDDANMYTMELYDYFTGDFWQVVPIGKQTIRQDQSKPLLFNYSFRLAAIQSLSQAQPSSIADKVLSTLTSSVNQALGAVNTALNSVLGGYASVTIGSAGLRL